MDFQSRRTSYLILFFAFGYVGQYYSMIFLKITIQKQICFQVIYAMLHTGNKQVFAYRVLNAFFRCDVRTETLSPFFKLTFFFFSVASPSSKIFMFADRGGEGVGKGQACPNFPLPASLCSRPGSRPFIFGFHLFELRLQNITGCFVTFCYFFCFLLPWKSRLPPPLSFLPSLPSLPYTFGSLFSLVSPQSLST